MKLVIIESPLGTNADGSRCTPEQFKRNQEYVNACMLDCLRKGEVPFASHAIYPLVLKDADPSERRLGMEAGFAVAKAFCMADRLSYLNSFMRTKANEEPVVCMVAHYTDRGTSSGMLEVLERHRNMGIAIYERSLGGDWSL